MRQKPGERDWHERSARKRQLASTTLFAKRTDGELPEAIPFSEDQFGRFCERLVAQPDIDITDDDTCKRIRAAVNSPVEKCEKLDDRTVFGVFRSLYSGHAYDNTDVGEIPDSSVSLRPFFFLAYLSESGRIYVASQYLGQFGGYTGLFKTLRLMLPQNEPVVSYAFRHDGSTYRGAKPKEVRVSFSRKPREITGTQKFGQRGAMMFRRLNSKDEEFNTTVSTKVLAKLGESNAVLRQAVADMLANNEMLSIRDDDIEDCTVIATVDGQNRTINVIEAGHFATRFTLEVEDYIKGHPSREKAKSAMIKLLKEQIISRTERV